MRGSGCVPNCKFSLLSVLLWKTDIVATYTLSLEGTRPPSKHSCKKDRITGVGQFTGSTLCELHQLSKTFHLWAYTLVYSQTAPFQQHYCVCCISSECPNFTSRGSHTSHKMRNIGNNSLGSTLLSCTCSAQLSPVPSNTMTRALASPQPFHYVSLPLWEWLNKVCLKRLCVRDTDESAFLL